MLCTLTPPGGAYEAFPSVSACWGQARPPVQVMLVPQDSSWPIRVGPSSKGVSLKSSPSGLSLFDGTSDDFWGFGILDLAVCMRWFRVASQKLDEEDDDVDSDGWTNVSLNKKRSLEENSSDEGNKAGDGGKGR